MSGMLWFACAMGNVAWAQSCLPGDNSPNCNPAATSELNRTLELPPQLAADLSTLENTTESSQEGRGSVFASQAPSEGKFVMIPLGTPTWGAFAKDLSIPGVAGMGVSSNWLTPEEAQMDALQLCAENGGKHCFVEEIFSNRCLGLALNVEQRIFWSVDVNAEMAAQSTMMVCTEKSSSECKVLYVGCSYPVQ